MAEYKLHVVMFPWLAFGHMTPFLELSKFLAQKGHHISFISTPRNIQRLPKIPPNLSPLIDLVELPLPHVDNLPDDAEATMDVPYNKVHHLKKAFDGLEEPLAHFLEISKPDWIIQDFTSNWLPPIASKLGSACAIFCTFNAAMLSFLGSPSEIMRDDGGSRKSAEDFTAPPKWIPFPSNLAFRLHELIKLAAADEHSMGTSESHRIGLSVLGCDIVVVRSCWEFESEFLQLVEELYQKPIVPIGLIPPVNRYNDDENWIGMKNWLDRQQEKCVVYVALGTEATLSTDEVTELAHGLELSGFPFFWVLRTPPSFTGGYWDDMLPIGFEDRVKDRGFLCKGWAPQVRILGHRSIGCFLTHCGWNSIIEGLGLGCPLVLLPLVNDQAINARLLGWKKVGVEVPREEINGDLRMESVAKTLKMVMVGKDGEDSRAKAKEMKEIFGDKTLNDKYMSDFEQYLIDHKR